jgi:hypothetical protein
MKQLIWYSTLLFKLNELLVRLVIFKLNSKNTVQNKLHHKVVNMVTHLT